MYIDILRNLFSKAIIIISSDSIKVIYKYNIDGLFHQDFDGENKERLLNLVKNSKNITTRIKSGDSVTIAFDTGHDINTGQIVLLQPIEHEITIDEAVENLRKESIKRGITDLEREENAQIVLSYVNPDMNHEELEEGLAELFRYFDSLNNNRPPIDISARINYKALKEAGFGLYKFIEDTVIIDPEDDFNGCVQCNCTEREIEYISAEFKNALTSMIALSSEFCFSGESDVNGLELSFYP